MHKQPYDMAAGDILGEDQGSSVMTERKLRLYFNSAITGPPLEDGTLEEPSHQEQTLPLHKLIIQVDGIAFAFISRFVMEISYYEAVTTPQQILTAAQEAIDTLMAIEGMTLFPLRGEKKPTVTLDSSTQPPQPRSTHLKKVIVRLPSDLTAFPMNDATWQEHKEHVGGHLVRHEGVRGFEIYLREVIVTFDTGLTTATAIKRHISRSLGLLNDGVRIFPFLGDRKLRFVKVVVVDA